MLCTTRIRASFSMMEMDLQRIGEIRTRVVSSHELVKDLSWLSMILSFSEFRSNGQGGVPMSGLHICHKKNITNLLKFLSVEVELFRFRYRGELSQSMNPQTWIHHHPHRYLCCPWFGLKPLGHPLVVAINRAVVVVLDSLSIVNIQEAIDERSIESTGLGFPY